jgi:hypothetical protein
VEIDPHLLRVAVTSQERIIAIFGGVSQHRGSEEFQCDQGQCWEVTSSIYVAAGDFEVSTVRQEALIQGLGLAGDPYGR